MQREVISADMKSIDVDPEIAGKYVPLYPSQCNIDDSEVVNQRLSKTCDLQENDSNLHSNNDIPFYCSVVPAILSGGSDYFGLGSIQL